MCKSLYSRYHQKGWQWQITALEMQHKEEIPQAKLPPAIPPSLFARRRETPIHWYSCAPTCVQAAGRHGSSCFSTTEWASVLKSGHTLGVCLWDEQQPANWHRPPRPHRVFHPRSRTGVPENQRRWMENPEKLIGYTGWKNKQQGKEKKYYSGLNNACWLSWRRRVCWIELLTELARRFTSYSNSQTGAALSCPRAATADTHGGTYTLAADGEVPSNLWMKSGNSLSGTVWS